ncbi:hypothetical protein CVT25_000916 [Psilocybe cyanescens]|uniref:Protein kinase domain-containing protein n=1 Tax=Psilocybe cyanescens TaxID=93625 RepID=A0A409WZC8_PSICY|nr:hypothetical protein CVT25_000916 [Psilocybe cyanescens]
MNTVVSAQPRRPPSLVKARREVEELRHMRLPFGQVFMSKVVSQFAPISSSSFESDSVEARSILAKCDRTHVFFSKRIKASRFEWLKSHQHVRIYMEKMLSSKYIRYEMDEREAERWTADVYGCLRSTIEQMGTPPCPQNVDNKELWQTAIDVMYELIKAFLKEAILLRLVPHPHILPFMGIVMTDDSLQILSLWMENGDILAFTKNNPNESKKELLEQVADGLDFLHRYNVVHSDLKSANVLITEEKKACIADLGAARLASSTMPSFPTLGTGFRPHNSFPVQMTANMLTNHSQVLRSNESSIMSNVSNAGTLRYMSPERLDPPKFSQSSAQATFASDVFSFGMLAYEVHAGKLPFSDVKNDIGLAMAIVDGRRPLRPGRMQNEM